MARFVGIDLGAWSVKVAHLVPVSGGGFEVEDFSEQELGPAVNAVGEVVPLEERHEAALSALKERGALVGDIFVTGLPGDMASVRTLTFPFSDPKKIAQVLPSELEAEIPFDIEDVVTSWTILEKTPTLTTVLVAFARVEAVEAHLTLLAKVGIDPRHVKFDALALDDLHEMVFRNEEDDAADIATTTPGGTVIETGDGAPEPGVAIVDIGHRRTSVCVLTKTGIVSAQTLLHGGADATRALAREIGLSIDEAERGKRKEAFIEVTGAAAQFPEQRQISDILKGAYGPIVRRLRQIFQAAMSTSRVRVTRVIITGGGSRVLNLDRFLSESLNVRTQRGDALAEHLRPTLPVDADKPEAAGAISYALAGMRAEQSRAPLDFRSGIFAWRGDFDFIRDRAVAIASWAGVLLFLALSGSVATSWTLGAEDDRLLARQAKACETITGQKIDSATRCLAIIDERIGAEAPAGIPERSAVDTYLEVSRRFPTQETMPRKVTDLDINDERVRIKGHVADFDGIDKIVTGLADGKCFDNVEKGKARNVKEGVEFSISLQLDCEKAPGKPLPEGSKPKKVTPTETANLKAVDDTDKKVKPGAKTATKKPMTAADRAKRNAGSADKIKEAQERARERAAKARERARERLEQRKVEPTAADEKRQERLEKLKRIREQRNRMRTLRSDDVDAMERSKRVRTPGIDRLRVPSVNVDEDDAEEE